MNHSQIIKDLLKLQNPQKARVLSGFFKTGKGEYGEGDIFWGISVPDQRIVAKKYSNIDINDVTELLNNKVHEYRLTALLILVDKYHKSGSAGKKQIFDLYLNNTKYINNWDLVDLSASNIVGDYLLSKDKSLLSGLARSHNLWERRISIVATYTFIRHKKYNETLKIAEILLNDKHDLIHKAVGWMLREVGKRSREVEEQFLKRHYRQMPRTMLRYAIERFEKRKKEFYMRA